MKPYHWRSELRKRLLAAFHANGIEIPRPQRVVLTREAGNGALAPELSPDLDPGTDDLGNGGPAPDPTAVSNVDVDLSGG